MPIIGDMVASASPCPCRCAQRHDVLIAQHLEFARGVARRLRRRLPAWADWQELESDAYLGLIIAARTFDPGRGVQFKTYAEKRIVGQVIDGLRDRQSARRRWPKPTVLSLEAHVGSEAGRALRLGDTVADDSPAVGAELEAMDEAGFMLRGLRPSDRQLFLDVHLHGLSQCDAGAKLGISGPTASQRMSSIRQRLLKEARCARCA